MAEAPLAVYVHWPYCARICPYCDFNVYKRRTDDALLPAILSDLEHWRDMSGPRHVTSIHFGGGTPSLMKPEQVEAVIQQVDRLWGLSEPEIALEANPNEAHEEDWRAYRDAGLTRLSLGVQTFQNGALKLLGRDHDGVQAERAVELAMEVFPSVSADLIFGWMEQSEDLLNADLDRLLSADVPHISTYQLTIEEGTAFAKAKSRGQSKAVDSDRSADFYDLVRDRLIAAGYDHYEVSNFAKPGHRSHHNLAYWRGQDYVGVGPGAHGRVTLDGKKNATVAHLRPNDYVQSVKESGTGIEILDILSDQARAEEYLLMGLRISEGISVSIYEELADRELDKNEKAALIEDGLLIQSSNRLIATAEGRLVLNAVTERLLLH